MTNREQYTNLGGSPNNLYEKTNRNSNGNTTYVNGGVDNVQTSETICGRCNECGNSFNRGNQESRNQSSEGSIHYGFNGNGREGTNSESLSKSINSLNNVNIEDVIHLIDLISKLDKLPLNDNNELIISSDVYTQLSTLIQNQSNNKKQSVEVECSEESIVEDVPIKDNSNETFDGQVNFVIVTKDTKLSDEEEVSKVTNTKSSFSDNTHSNEKPDGETPFDNVESDESSNANSKEKLDGDNPKSEHKEHKSIFNTESKGDKLKRLVLFLKTVNFKKYASQGLTVIDTLEVLLDKTELKLIKDNYFLIKGSLDLGRTILNAIKKWADPAVRGISSLFSF